MKLERFKEKDNKRKLIIIFTVCSVLLLAGVFLYTSYAIFTEEKEFNVINGQYQDPGDLYFTVYIDGKITNTIPAKDSGYTLDTEKSSCTNGTTMTWDNSTWSASINLTNYQAGNMSRTKCTMYFIKDPTAADFIKDLVETSEELVYDETSDNNLRYIGADPNNYVLFNDELWRIIGVMNNIDDGTGTKETRLKIIRDESIGWYSWDNKASDTGSSTSIFGSNDWSDSALQIVLNSGAYWNRTSGACPYDSNGATITCDFSNNGLTDVAKSMMDDAVWNLGGLSSNSNDLNYYGTAITSTYYIFERSTIVFEGRPTTWTGKIGLMYPSDYGYATSGGSVCLSYSLSKWNDYSTCYMNNWLYTDSYQWILTPHSSSSSDVFRLSSNIFVADNHVYYASNVSPTTYLKSSIKIIGGTGSSSDPFELSL